MPGVRARSARTRRSRLRAASSASRAFELALQVVEEVGLRGVAVARHAEGGDPPRHEERERPAEVAPGTLRGREPVERVPDEDFHTARPVFGVEKHLHVAVGRFDAMPFEEDHAR